MQANQIVDRLLEDDPSRDIPAFLAQWLAGNGFVRKWIYDPYDTSDRMGAYEYSFNGSKLTLKVKPSVPDFGPDRVDVDIHVHAKETITSVDKSAKETIRFIQLLISRYERP